MKNELIFAELRDSLKEYNKSISKKKKQLTPDFNLIDLISPKELQISRIIAEFLNPKGTHEHRNLFLNTFIETFLTKNKKLSKSKEVSVVTEFAQGVDGQIDIMIDFDQTFGIAIENKPFANDQENQIIRYVKYLEKKYGSKKFFMIYLSSRGNAPSEDSLPNTKKIDLGDNFVTISYQDIRIWFLQCHHLVIKNGANRLATLILEIAEYINLSFLNTNKIKNEMLSETIKSNILDAFEIKKLWKKNEQNFNNLWRQKINQLFNIELPKLVFKELLKENIIDEEWEFIEGDFDIQINAIRGFQIKKKSWTEFSYVFLSSKIKTPKGSRDFFPAIMSKKKLIDKYPNYIETYSNATNCESKKELWKIPPLIWWSIFPNKKYRIWDYEQWIEIKEGGQVVRYLADFFGKLIDVSKHDIEEVENERV